MNSAAIGMCSFTALISWEGRLGKKTACLLVKQGHRGNWQAKDLPGADGKGGSASPDRNDGKRKTILFSLTPLNGTSHLLKKLQKTRNVFLND
jgi:hypothetical protein